MNVPDRSKDGDVEMYLLGVRETGTLTAFIDFTPSVRHLCGSGEAPIDYEYGTMWRCRACGRWLNIAFEVAAT
jgi:hypothetical protein